MNVSYVNMIDDSSFGIQQSSDSMLNMIRTASPDSDTNLLQASEKQLNINKLNNELVYNASLEMEKSQKKVEKENIKRTFSMFS